MVVIIGIIGAIAIPRMSRGAVGAGESSLVQNLRVIRAAIELYREEHGGAPPTDHTTFAAQMTLYTDLDGNTNPSRTAVFRYGPYLRSVPPLPVGSNAGSTSIFGKGPYGTTADGWFYGAGTVVFYANLPVDEKDSQGVSYKDY